jgi:hypothetical protein
MLDRMMVLQLFVCTFAMESRDMRRTAKYYDYYEKYRDTNQGHPDGLFATDDLGRCHCCFGL